MDEAIAAVEHLGKVDPMNVEAFAYLGTLKYMTGQLDGAINAYRRAVEINPKSSAPLVSFGSRWSNDRMPLPAVILILLAT